MTAGLCKPFTQVKIGSLLRWVDETDDGLVYDYTNDSVRPGAFGLMRDWSVLPNATHLAKCAAQLRYAIDQSRS